MAATETIAAFPLLGTVETGSSFPWLNAAGDGNYRSGKDALADFLEVGTLLAAKQDSNTSLDAIAGMTPSAFGLSLLDDADAATARTTLGLGSLSLLSSLETGALTHAPTNYTPSAATMAGHLVGIDTALAGGSGAFTADANTQITPSTAIVLDQATGNETALTLDYTTNKATSGNDTGLLINQTDTASPGTSKLMDLQVGGASKFSVDAAGEVFGSGVNSRLRLTDSVGAELEYSNWRIGIGGPTAYFYQTTIAKVGMGADGLRLTDSGALRWSSGSQASTGHDLLLTRDSAATLQLGENDATVATGQTIKAHDVVTGTGADLALSGGLGSIANGDVVLQPTSGNVGIGTTTPGAALDVATTWNDGATVFTGIKADVTNTSSAVDSKLLDLQRDGQTKFNVNWEGTTSIWSEVNRYDLVLGNTINSNGLAIKNVNVFKALVGPYHSSYNSDYLLRWGNSTTATPVQLPNDLVLGRGSVATLQLGVNDATVATGQTIKAHDVATGTGADLTLSGGLGSVANGDIILSGNVHSSQITGTENNFVGAGAGESNSGNNSSGFGYQSLYQNVGNDNTASGYQSLHDSTGDSNTASGVHTLRANTGSNNTASGYWSLYYNTGDGNTATGYYALRVNTGHNNTAIGLKSLWGNNGSYNTASGWSALQQNTGSNNTASGSYSLYQNTGSNNTASGYWSLNQNTGGNNTASGYQAGRYQSGGSTTLTTASNSVFLGATTKGIQGATNQIVIGDTAESIGANSVVLGNDSIVTTALKGSVGIGTTTPNANAILDVSSTTKAFLLPRMTTTEKTAVASPAAGMLVYDSTLNKLAVYTGAAWEAITSA